MLMDIIEKIRKLSLGDNYEIIPYDESLKLEGFRHVAHCGIYALHSHIVERHYPTKAAILMVFRTDGMLGFPGGCVDKGENIMEGLKRELKEEINLDMSELDLDDPSYMNTLKYSMGTKQCCHFFKLEVTIEKFESIEKGILNAKEYGFETFGLLRVPLFTMNLKDGHGGFPAFLCNNFIADSQAQLLTLVANTGIMSLNEIIETVNIYKSMKFSHS